MGSKGTGGVRAYEEGVDRRLELPLDFSMTFCVGSGTAKGRSAAEGAGFVGHPGWQLGRFAFWGVLAIARAAEFCQERGELNFEPYSTESGSSCMYRHQQEEIQPKLHTGKASNKHDQ